MPIEDKSVTILILSEENLRILKNVLMTDYEVSSSHASELIAALSGFKTYTAFKAKLETFNFAPTVRIDFDWFEKRHLQLGYDQSSGEWMRLSYNQLVFRNSPWLMHSTGRKFERDVWFKHCERNSMPFITIHKKNKYCYLEWDCISIDPAFEAHVRHKMGDELVHTLIWIYKLVANRNEPKSFFDGSAFYGNLVKLSEGAARQIANEFFMELTPWKLHPN
jgi:hypothetical protein